MGSVVKINSLTSEQKNLIVKDLTIKSKDKQIFGNPNSKTKKYVNTKEICMYKKIEDSLQIPFYYSIKLTQKHLNIREFRKLNITFKGDLLERQVPVFEEAVQHLKKGSAIINVYPGFGKTVLGARLIKHLSIPALVLIHRTNLGDQWLKTFTDHLPDAKVWVVETSDQFKLPPEPVDIIICMDERSDLLPPDIVNSIGILLIDEAHCFCTPSRIECILKFRPKFVIAETATFERFSDGLHQTMEMICGPNKIVRKYQEPFTVIKYNTGIELESRSVMGSLDWNFLLEQMASNLKRNEIICNIVKKESNKKILILVNRREHVSALKSLIDQTEKCDTLLGGKNKYKDSRILIGTMSKIGTGFDEKNACDDYSGIRINCLILASSIKDLALLEQNVGRVFRAENPVIYDLVDRNNVLKSHFYERRSWYTSMNCVIETDGV